MNTTCGCCVTEVNSTGIEIAAIQRGENTACRGCAAVNSAEVIVVADNLCMKALTKKAEVTRA